MRDISMHVLDIAMNSINAHASLVTIKLTETDSLIRLVIEDNGVGMSKQALEKVRDPFYTTRTTRKIGLGIPLLYQNVTATGGTLNISAVESIGTIVDATFNKEHIDCIPLGNIGDTIVSLIMLDPHVDFLFIYKNNNDEYELDTREIKKLLQEVRINDISVINWLKEDLKSFFK